MTLHKIAFCLIFLLLSCSKQVKNQQPLEILEAGTWVNLIDKDLSKWDTYLSYQIQPGYDGTQPKNEQGELVRPIGLNKPGYDVFTTIQEGDGTIIRNTGEYYGCLVTKEEFKNYHFQLKYKWGNKTWAYRKDLLKDSGILYHSIGPMAAEFWRSWMLSQEFQIMEGHTGDFWSQANSAIDIRAYKPESNLNPLAHESQDYLPITMHGPYGNYCLRSGNYEKPHDEWNTLDLYCFEGKSLHVVNGEVVMILKNSRYIDENGNSVPLIKGKIQLQSEAAEIFFKDIRIREIDSLTPEQKALF
ncbi:DUF1080 domain-containing protein [Tamlana fucoidanivorans]|uniref:DUF1080 domain-containing protein n=1 Tax=Allotamlana fucoidanivorans TaxID=2583814 RepID=A0A5C4SRZ4_9FLAO|nr:DUF1080 domain-containing protein [Tamlana fucoidanivorans]TNJ47186.1 DUF1080 domain-containing protein [Tamlana fucoidanivorans]